jgi:hypothetical protein
MREREREMKRHGGRESETKGIMRWNCVRIGILM